jgi:hypothetical protein
LGLNRGEKASKPQTKNFVVGFTVDMDYMTLAILIGVFGIVGITVTANVSPNIFASATCNCVPSPEARLQELSVISLAFSAVLTPIGLTRKTPAADSPTGPNGQGVMASGRVYTASPMRSGSLFTLGVSLVVLGVAVVAIPAFLVLMNPLLIGEGTAMVGLGVFLAYSGGRAS